MEKSQLLEYIYKLCIYATPLLIGLYLTLGRIFLYSGGPIHATDLETPLNSIFYFWNFLYPSHPAALGSIAYPATYDFIYGCISIVSFSNEFASQVLVLSLPPIVAYTGVLLLTRKIMKTSVVASIFASVFYAFSPSFLAWFTLPYMLGVALVPWLFYIGLSAFKYIFSDRQSLIILLFYSLMFALILSLLTGLYFHILPLILISLVISFMFMIIALPFKVTRKHILWLGVLICLIGFFYFLSSPRIFDLSSTLTAENPALSTPIDVIKDFYQEATILNNFKLAGGTPNNERFILLRENPIGFFIPILAFSGLLFIKNKDVKSLFSTKIILLYSSFVVNSIVLLAIAYIFREFVFSNNLIVTNIYLSGMRRPERILEMLSLFYSLGMAFSLSVIQCKLSKSSATSSKSPSVDKSSFAESPLSISHRKTGTILLIILIFTYVFYSGIYVAPNHPANAQFFSSRPEDFTAVENFLNQREIQASEYDATFRYSILPLYSPLIGYFRYNYPNIFYVGSFAPDYVRNFIMTTNKMIAEKDTSAIWPLSLSSVKYIGILPQSFSEDELQSWRLKGEIRTSGAFLFGDPQNYNSCISNLPNSTLLYQDEMSVYTNELAIPRVFAPEMLVHAQGDLIDVFRSLSELNSMFPLSNFVLMVNQSKAISSGNSFIIDDFDKQSQIEVDISNLTEHKFEYKFDEKKVSINESSVIVWSQQKMVSVEENIIMINGTIPPNQQHLSVWVKIPPTSSLMNLQLILGDELLDKISFSILDEATALPAEIENTTTSAIDDKVNLDVLVNSKDLRPTTFRIIVQGESNSSVEIALKNEIQFKEIFGLELYYDDTFDMGKKQKEGTEFSIVVPNQEGAEVYWPLNVNEHAIEYAITAPIETHKALVFAVSINESSGWHKIDESVKWSSPVGVQTDLDISLREGKNEIMVPLFFGNVYDKSWKLEASVNSGRITEIEHMIGNYYGNIWFVRISEIQQETLSLHFNVYWDSFELQLYRMHTFAGVVSILLAIPLGILWAKRNKPFGKKNSPDLSHG